MTALTASDGWHTARCRVLVTVGTDHHPFDRLVGWINDWLRTDQDLAAGCFIQWGTSTARPACAGSRILGVSELTELLDAADVIVCHGGPASISEAWKRGRMPIVVPRLASLGEHVDDHQAEFCDKMSQLGKVALARTLPELTGLLTSATGDPAGFSASNSGSDTDEVAARIGALVEELAGRPRRQSLIGRVRRFRRDPVTAAGAPAGRGDLTPGPFPAASTTWQPARVTVRAGLAATPKEEQE